LENACALLGWDLEVLGWTGVIPGAVPTCRGPMPIRDLELLQEQTKALAIIIRRWKPHWIFYPHMLDAHPTHRGVSGLVTMALKELGDAAPPWRVRTEYWQPNLKPNLLVECPPELLALQVAALCCHEGEVARNPYHLTLPAWMADNVRRGAELVTRPGAAAPTFKFGTLYRVRPDLPPGWNPILPATTRLSV
jgi:LmbE family N-acetylglucosaminyl deacetylase